MKKKLFYFLSLLLLLVGGSNKIYTIINKEHLKTSKEKQDAVSIIANAYYKRGKYIQYDQKKMDLNATTDSHTNRREQNVSPEDANKMNTIYLDCSSFVYNVYKEAFDYELTNILTTSSKRFNDFTTKNLANINNSSLVYKYTYNSNYKDSNIKKQIINKVQSTLQPGDLLVSRRKRPSQSSESGHVMLYVIENGKGYLIHATGKDYNYDKKIDKVESSGAIKKTPLTTLFNNSSDSHYLFSTKDTMKSLVIIRPLNMIGNDLTSKTKERVKSNGLYFEQYASINEAKGTEKGETIKYTITVKNNGTSDKVVNINSQVPNYTSTSDKTSYNFTLKKGESKTVYYNVLVNNDNVNIVNDKTTVNGVKLNTITHYSKNKLSNNDITKLKNTIGKYNNKTVKYATSNYSSITNAPSTNKVLSLNNGRLVSSIYYNAFKADLGIESSEQLVRIFFNSSSNGYTLRKSTSGLSDKEKKIFSMLVPNMYGGTKLITTDLNDKINRTRNLTFNDMIPGDIIFDRFDNNGALYLYLGDNSILTIGSKSGIVKKDLARIQECLGNDVYALLRPSYILSSNQKYNDNNKELNSSQINALDNARNRFEKRIKAGTITYNSTNRNLNVYPENAMYLDSSSLIYNIYYSAFNVKLPTSTSNYFKSNLDVISNSYSNVSNIKVGDVIVYEYNNTGVNALYVSNDKVLRFNKSGIFYQSLSVFINECKSRNASKFAIFRPVNTMTLNVRNDSYVDATSITGDSTINLSVGEYKTINASIKPDNATNKKLIFTSENKNIATVDYNGKIKGINKGTTNIIIKSHDNVGLTKTVKVVVVGSSTVKFNNSSYNILKGHFMIINPIFDGGYSGVSYKSSNTNIATVINNGSKVIVNGINKGTATITASLPNGNSVSTTIYVKDNNDKREVSFQSSSYTVNVGNTKTLSPSTKIGYNSSISFTSENNSCLEVIPTSSGRSVVIKGIKKCTTKITAKLSNGKHHTVTVYVK